jgi:hypothetical protein
MKPQAGQETKARLLGVYRDLLARASLLQPSTVERLGCPFLIFPKDRWFESACRVLIVGQEPYEWGFNKGEYYPWPHPDLWTLKEVLDYQQSVEALTEAYVVSYEAPDSPGAFARSLDLSMKAANREGKGDVISTNLFRCVYRMEGQPDKRSPLKAPRDELQRILDWQCGCLSEEVRTLRPTSVIFFTGPDYDPILVDEFQDAVFQAVDDRDSRQFARVVHSLLPEVSFRTYHPTYLARSGRWPWVEQLCERISG